MFDLEIAHSYRAWYVVNGDGETVEGPFDSYTDAEAALDDLARIDAEENAEGGQKDLEA